MSLNGGTVVISSEAGAVAPVMVAPAGGPPTRYARPPGMHGRPGGPGGPPSSSPGRPSPSPEKPDASKKPDDKDKSKESEGDKKDEEKKEGETSETKKRSTEPPQPADPDELNPGTRSIQCGRRNDALKLWAAWLYHGDDGFEQRINRLFDLATYAADAIRRDPEFELAVTPQSINICFEVRGVPSEEICDQLDRDGELMIGHGTVNGRTTIRLVCVNPDFNNVDIDRILGQVKQAATILRG